MMLTTMLMMVRTFVKEKADDVDEGEMRERKMMLIMMMLKMKEQRQRAS